MFFPLPVPVPEEPVFRAVQGKNAFFLKKSCETHLKTGRSVVYYVYASQQCEAEMLLQERFSDGS